MTTLSLAHDLALAIRQNEAIAAIPPDAPLAEVREGYRRATRAAAAPHPEGLRTDSLTLGGVPCRRYRPDGAGASVVLWFHGGGWAMGDLDTHDSFVADLAQGVGCTAIAVDYRLAPEHPFPAAFDDALSAFSALRDDAAEFDLDRARIVLAGDSAGGNLAAALSQTCRDRGERCPLGQMLLYPVLSSAEDSPSRLAMADLPGWTAADLRAVVERYLDREPAESDRADPRLFPGDAPDLEGLPPTVMSAAEYDVLASDVPAYAARLRQAGVPVDAWIESGLPHGWLRHRRAARAPAAAFARLVDATRRLVAA